MAVFAFVAGAALPSFAADWTDANNATYTALKSIKATATAIKTGGSWIVTDITPTSNDTVKTRFKLNNTWTQALWCARTNGSSGQFGGFYLSSVIRCDRDAKQKSGSTKPSTTGGDCTLVADYATGKFIVDGEYQSGTMADTGNEGEYQVGSTLMLFGSHEKGSALTPAIAADDVGNRASCDLYYFQLYSSEGTLTHNLMPAVRDSDQEIGLYDTVTGSFYAKADNSGSFASTAKAAVSGTPVKWTGLGGDNKMSNDANWEGGAAPVAGQDLDFTLATPFAAIDADINATFGKVWLSDVEKTTFAGTLTALEASDRAMIDVAEGASVTILNAVTAATWTGAAENGLFQDPNNWTCINVLGNQVAGVPAADAAITLAADVPANGWADADFAEMSGSIDLAGHSLTVPGAFFNVAPPAEKNVIVNGNFEADQIPYGGSSSSLPKGWTRHSNSQVQRHAGNTYNNGKTDNGCYIWKPGYIEQTFTLLEDASLTITYQRINKNTKKGSYTASSGNCQIDGKTVDTSSESGYGVKTRTVHVALAAGSHTIRFNGTATAGSTFDNIKMTYQPSARTVTDSVGGGELHVNVPEGETVANAGVNMTGHLRLVKEGAGAFVSQRTALTYDGGTKVVAGTLSTSEGVAAYSIASRTFGALESDITVLPGGTLKNYAGSYDFPNYNVILDGGAFAAGAAGSFIETNGVCSVSVGANGGTIDNGGFAVTLASDIAGAGALAFTGTGTTALSPGVSVACPATVESGTTLTINGAAQSSFGSLTLAAGSTLDIANYNCTTPVVATSVTLPAEGNVNLTLNGGAFSRGIYAICAAPGLTAADGGKFTFDTTDNQTATWSVADGTLLLTVGDISGNYWTGLGGDGKMSTAANWLNGVPAAGEDLDLSLVSFDTTIIADTDRAFGAVTMGTGVITFTNSLTATSISDTSKVAVAADSTVTLEGNLVIDTTSGNKYIVNSVAAGGKFKVTGKIRAIGTNSLWPSQVTCDGAIEASGLVCAVSGSDLWTFRLSNSGGHIGKWIIGEDGLVCDGAAGFWVHNNSKDRAEIQAAADFTIQDAWIGLSKAAPTFTIQTTSPDSIARTITAKTGFVANDAGTGNLDVCGSGTFLCDYTAQAFSGGTPKAFSGVITVKDTATLAVNPEKYPTTGAISVDNGATFKVAKSGTVTLMGNLTLADGAALGFNFTERNTSPQLALSSGNTMTAKGAVEVKISGAVRPIQGEHVLTTCGGFTAENVSLAAGAPDWVRGLSVNADGNIVLNVKPMGVMIIVH